MLILFHCEYFHVVILGGTPAQSKIVISTWLDSIITAVARAEPRMFSNHGNRQHGLYQNLQQDELAEILRLISGLNQWASECLAANCSCGVFNMVVPAGQGRKTLTPITIGPFMR